VRSARPFLELTSALIATSAFAGIAILSTLPSSALNSVKTASGRCSTWRKSRQPQQFPDQGRERVQRRLGQAAGGLGSGSTGQRPWQERGPTAHHLPNLKLPDLLSGWLATGGQFTRYGFCFNNFKTISRWAAGAFFSPPKNGFDNLLI
jgi:hypothetical protein